MLKTFTDKKLEDLSRLVEAGTEDQIRLITTSTSTELHKKYPENCVL